MAWGTGTERYFHGSDSKIRHHSTYSLTLASGSYSFLDLGTQKTSRSKNRETGKPTNYQTEYLTAKGETNYFDVRLSPITREGKVVSVVSSANDVTERKQIEEELKKHRQNLEELIKERTRELGKKNVELERFNKLFINREFRIKELKKKLRKYEP